MNHLVIGLGEVGSALQAILKCEGVDYGGLLPRTDVLHVCFPYSESFASYVEEYRKATGAKYVIIHSTVPVGTSSKLQACHSPIRGVHPHLEQSIRTFVKYIGGKDSSILAEELGNYGLTCIPLEKSETTELMKLVDTTSYGVNILIEKEIHRLCDEYQVPFEDVYNGANLTYNEGYMRLGMPQFQKYNLKHFPGKIGGHCVNENAQLLSSWMNDLINNEEINK